MLRLSIINNATVALLAWSSSGHDITTDKAVACCGAILRSSMSRQLVTTRKLLSWETAASEIPYMGRCLQR